LSTEEKCDQCQESGVLGREIRAYRFATPSGAEVIRYLHPNDGERRCYHEYEAKYRAHMAKRKAASG
jgi:hypothetical protein